MKRILLYLIALLSFAGKSQSNALPISNQINHLLNTSLFCKDLGLFGSAKIYANNAINILHDTNTYRIYYANSLACLGLIYNNIELSDKPRKKYLNLALKEYINSNLTTSYESITAIKQLLDLNSLPALANNTYNCQINFGKYSEIESINPNVKYKITHLVDTLTITKIQTSTISTPIQNNKFSDADFFYCLGVYNFQNLNFLSAEGFFKESLLIKYNDTKFSPNIGLDSIGNSALGYLKKCFDERVKKSDLYPAFLCTTESYILDNITTLNIFKESLNSDAEIISFKSYIESQLQNKNASPLCRAYLFAMHGILNRNQKKFKNTYNDFDSAVVIFVSQNINSPIVGFLKKEIESLSRIVKKSKPEIIENFDLESGEKSNLLYYKNADIHSQDKDSYAGIEIGSSGVKLTVINIKVFPDRFEYHDLYPPVSNPIDVTKFDRFTSQQVIQAVKEYYDKIVNEYKIPNSNIFISFSSGCNDAASEKHKVQELNDIKKGIIEQTGKTPSVLSLSEEAKLTHLGLVPYERRLDVTSIDVGGTNTKGGYFYKTSNANTYRWGAFMFAYGTKSLLENATQFSDKKYETSADLYALKDRLNNFMEAQSAELENQVSGNMKDDQRVVFSGGISWVIARLMKPNNIYNYDFVDDITIADVREFKNQIIRIGLNGLIQKQLNSLKNLSPENIDLLKSEYEQIKAAKFTDARCLSGATIIEYIMMELDNKRGTVTSNFSSHDYSFAVKGLVAWLNGKIVSCIEGNCE